MKTAPVKTDGRVRRTRDTLGEALIALMQEKSFDEITVQDVLDRAGVGRSTFYAHFSDKDDLLLSDVEDFFGYLAGLLTRTGADPRRVVPVREFFAHLGDVKDFHRALVASGKLRDVFELGQGFFARSIEERLQRAGVIMEPVELKARCHALAAAFFSLAEWWIDHSKAETPEAMDAIFHRMVWSGIRRARPLASSKKDEERSPAGVR